MTARHIDAESVLSGPQLLSSTFAFFLTPMASQVLPSHSIFYEDVSGSSSPPLFTQRHHRYQRRGRRKSGGRRLLEPVEITTKFLFECFRCGTDTTCKQGKAVEEGCSGHRTGGCNRRAGAEGCRESSRRRDILCIRTFRVCTSHHSHLPSNSTSNKNLKRSQGLFRHPYRPKRKTLGTRCPAYTRRGTRSRPLRAPEHSGHDRFIISCMGCIPKFNGPPSGWGSTTHPMGTPPPPHSSVRIHQTSNPNTFPSPPHRHFHHPQNWGSRLPLAMERSHRFCWQRLAQDPSRRFQERHGCLQ